MTPGIDPAERARRVQRARAMLESGEVPSVNKAAARLGVAPGTLRGWAKLENVSLTDAAMRAATKGARDALNAYGTAARRRARAETFTLTERELARIRREQDAIEAIQEVDDLVFYQRSMSSSADGARVYIRAETPDFLGQLRNAAVTLGILQDKSVLDGEEEGSTADTEEAMRKGTEIWEALTKPQLTPLPLHKETA